jgi:thiamine transport system substrate-binding protein
VDGWADYWTALLDNGVRIVSDWSDAYEVDFTAGGGSGDRPLVVSYNSSPPFTIPEGGGRPTTSALLDTCFRQVEYAGVLAGADNPEGARALVDFMVGHTFQAALAENMYVFPVDDRVALPAVWARWAKPAPKPISVRASEIAEHRSEWIREWSDVTSR